VPVAELEFEGSMGLRRAHATPSESTSAAVIATASGRGAPGRSKCTSQSCERTATFPRSSSRTGSDKVHRIIKEPKIRRVDALARSCGEIDDAVKDFLAHSTPGAKMYSTDPLE